MKVLAIDPGVKSLGWAAFAAGSLIRCGLHQADDVVDMIRLLQGRWSGMKPELAVIEVPQVYQQRRWKGDPNDLIDVALVAGAVAGALASANEVRFVRPREWKGQRPKEICNGLTMRTLTEGEREQVETDETPRSKRHNVIDAVGLGLYAIGRRP